MADPGDKTKKAPAKGKKGKKGADDKAKRGKAKGGHAQMSVANHPRASAQVRRAKGWGGLVGFGLAALLSLKAGVPTADLGVRALIAGLAGYLVGWGCSVTAWRAILIAEMHARLERARAAAESTTLEVK